MRRLFYFLLAVAFLAGCSGKAEITEIKEYEDHIDLVKIHSAELEKNEYGETPDKTLYVYLPENYDLEDKHYPVIYFLHGYMGDATELFQFDKGLDQALAEGAIDDFILVSIDGNNRFQGSFYADSPISGNFETYIVEEVVPLIDKNYRTIDDRNSRGIFGFSMGGFGAVKLAFDHPDVFGSTLSLCGAFCRPDEISTVLNTWNRFIPQAVTAYQAAFTEENDHPIFSGSEKDNIILEEWKNGLSNWDSKTDVYLATDTPLNGIKLLYGSRDMWTWLNDGVLDLSSILTERGIDHEIKELNITHSISHATIRYEVMPFFAEHLVFEE